MIDNALLMEKKNHLSAFEGVYEQRSCSFVRWWCTLWRIIVVYHDCCTWLPQSSFILKSYFLLEDVGKTITFVFFIHLLRNFDMWMKSSEDLLCNFIELVFDQLIDNLALFTFLISFFPDISQFELSLTFHILLIFFFCILENDGILKPVKHILLFLIFFMLQLSRTVMRRYFLVRMIYFFSGWRSFRFLMTVPIEKIVSVLTERPEVVLGYILVLHIW